MGTSQVVVDENEEEKSDAADEQVVADEEIANNGTVISDEQQNMLDEAKEYINDTIEKYGQKFSIFALLVILFILGLVTFMVVRSCRKRKARRRAQMFHKPEKEFLLQDQGINMYEDESS